MSETPEPKIIVDSDWKSRVQSEKEAIKEQEQQPRREGQELPPASFPMLLSTLVTQALVALGQIPDPITGKPEFNFPVAGHFIDTLAMLEVKTKGNLTDDEAAMLGDVLHQLRLAFVSVQSSPPDTQASGSIEVP